MLESIEKIKFKLKINKIKYVLFLLNNFIKVQIQYYNFIKFILYYFL